MGLPFGYSNCARGTGGKPPKCYQWFDMEHPEVTRPPPPPEQEIASATLADAAPPVPRPALLGQFFGRPQPAVASEPIPPADDLPPPKPMSRTSVSELVIVVSYVVC